MNKLQKIINYPLKIYTKSKILQKKKLSDRFNYIYRENYWGDLESVSGPGSSLKNSRKITKTLKNIVRKYKIESIVDAPCGDCNWIKETFNNSNLKYLGIDIVPDLIKKNKSRFKNHKNINFKILDITNSKLPKSDLIICRDFLFHLSFKDGKKFLKNLFKSEFKYLLTSSHSNGIGNDFENLKDIRSGDFRRINIFQKPYNFNKKYELCVKDFCDDAEKYIILFKSKN
tara:strand:+ start:399 stop:1085 length:687 start_codon:yes stop_codon:yes gene_type:complete